MDNKNELRHDEQIKLLKSLFRIKYYNFELKINASYDAIVRKNKIQIVVIDKRNVIEIETSFTSYLDETFDQFFFYFYDYLCEYDDFYEAVAKVKTIDFSKITTN